METIKCTNCGKRFPKELVATECFDCYMLGAKKEREKERNRIVGLIDERIKMLKEIMANSKQVNKSTGLMDVFKASVKELEELKTRITGK